MRTHSVEATDFIGVADRALTRQSCTAGYKRCGRPTTGFRALVTSSGLPRLRYAGREARPDVRARWDARGDAATLRHRQASCPETVAVVGGNVDSFVSSPGCAVDRRASTCVGGPRSGYMLVAPGRVPLRGHNAGREGRDLPGLYGYEAGQSRSATCSLGSVICSARPWRFA